MSISAHPGESRGLAFGGGQSELTFRSVFDCAPIPMALIGLDGLYERVNRAMAQFTGYTEEQLIGMTMADITHPDDIDTDTSAMAELATGDEMTYTVDKRYITRTGEIVWGAKSATLVRGQDGSPLHCIAQIQDITARKMQEHELIEERRRLRDAESIGRTGSWEQDTVTGAVSWSPGLFELYGIGPNFDGDYLAALTRIHADDREAVDAAVQATREGQAGFVRYRVTRADDGDLRWFEGRGRSVWENGRVVRIAGAIVDITEQVLAQQELTAANALRQAVFDASPDVIAVWDLTSLSMWANRSITDQLGYDAEEAANMKGDLAAHLVLAQDKERFDASLSAVRAARDGEVIGLDFRMRHKDGSTRWFSRRIAPLRRDESGRVTHIVGISHESTAAKVTEFALRESQVLFQQLADSVSAAFTLRSWDPIEFLYVSPGYEKIFGYDPMAQHQGPQESLQHIHPDDLDRFLAEYWTVSAAGIAATCEYRIIRPNGEVRWVRAATAPVHDPTGRFRRSASTAEDVTVSKRAEIERLEAVAEAQRANAAKDRFFSRTSHELRTPLNGVIGYAQLLEMDSLPGHQRDAVSQILRSGRHLLRLVDILLDISKVVTDHLDLSMEAVPVAELIAETVRVMTPYADTAGVTVEFEPAVVTARPVRADHRRLRQVMLNLLSNAIKYNRPGGRVAITCEINDSHLDVTVTDTGCGICAADLPRLFSPFDRLGAEDAGVDGTGIGLALSERLMAVMGGHLAATSVEGEGSSFTASIPLAAERDLEQRDLELSWSFDALHATATPNEPVRTLLYIEDNSANVELMEQLIDRHPSWNLIVAGHGALGLELASTTHPDLVLLDLHLPDMNGIDILRRLRADPRTCDLKIIVLSADANPHQVDRLLAAGAHRYLTKPLNVPVVMQLLAQ